MLADPTTVLLFGLCCAISAGHVFTGLFGAATGRQRSELNGLFAGLSMCGAWTVFWLGAYQAFPLEMILRFRFASQLVSGFIGPLLLLFCFGLAHPDRPIPRWAYGVLALGGFGAAASIYGALHPDEVRDVMHVVLAGGHSDHPVVLPLFAVHTVASGVTAVAALGILVHGILRAPLPEVRTQCRWMLLAAGTVLSGILFGNVLPMALGVHLPFFAPLSTLPAIGIAYKALLSNRSLMARLTHERDHLSRFVPSVVARQAHGAALLGGKEAEVAILFTDIRGFTSLSQDLEPSALIEFLNQYLGRMTTIIQDHGGMVDKYIGDAVLAVFGLGEPSANACQAAFDAGIAMQRALDELNAEGLTPDLRMGVGIHFGTVVHGNVGSPDRMEYTVLGDTVNVASRVEAMTKELGVPIVVTADAAAHIRQKLVDLGTHAVRGRRDAVSVFGIAVSGRSEVQAVHDRQSPLDCTVDVAGALAGGLARDQVKAPT